MTEHLSFPCWVRLTKLDHCPDSRHSPAIAIGWSSCGWAPMPPTPGARFEIFSDRSRQRRLLSTSPVRECLSGWIFMTYNSFYLLEAEEEPAAVEELAREAELVG